MSNQKTPEALPILAVCGDPGLDRASGLVDEEFHRDLKGVKARKKYREMRDNSAILGSGLWLIESLIRRVSWSTLPNESGHPMADYVAEKVDEAFNDMATKWQGVVAEFMTAMVFGYSYLENTFKLRRGFHENEPRLHSKHDDGLYGWRDWGLRAQESLDRWLFADDGRVLGMYQRPPHDSRTRFIPADRALHFKIRATKGNPEGYSLLRVPYVSYSYASRLTEVEAIGGERQVAGMPVMELPPELMSPNATDTEKTIRAQYEKFVQKVRVDAYYGAVIPCEDLPDGRKSGYRFKLTSSSGKNESGLDPVIRRHERNMAMSLFIQFLLLGSDKAGSWALSDSHTHMLSMAIMATVESLAELCDDVAIPRLCRLNGWEPATFPTRKPGDIEKQSIVEAGQFIASMLGSGGMEPGKDLDDWARRMIDLEPREGTALDSMMAASVPEIETEPEPIEAADDDADPVAPELPTYVTPDEAAEMLGVSRNTINNAIKRGQLPGAKIGNTFRIFRDDLVEHFKAATGGNGAQQGAAL